MRGAYETALVLMILVLSSLSAVAGGFADLMQDWMPISLLRDRLQADVPRSAWVGPPAHNLMAAPSAAEQEVRVVIDGGPARLVMFVRELFRTATADFLATGTAYVKDMEVKGRLNDGVVAPPREAGGVALLEYEPQGEARVD